MESIREQKAKEMLIKAQKEAENSFDKVIAETVKRDALLKRRERKLGGAETSVRPNPNVPIGWPSDGKRPPWDPE